MTKLLKGADSAPIKGTVIRLTKTNLRTTKTADFAVTVINVGRNKGDNGETIRGYKGKDRRGTEGLVKANTTTVRGEGKGLMA